MTAERWQEVDALFRAALERPPEERRALLDEARNRDPELVSHVVDLLRAADESASFLESPVEDLGEFPWEEIFPAPTPDAGQDHETASFDRSGERCGHYRLERRIGRGGMATVYLAERADGQWDQQVAVKILRRGLDTEDVVRRFRSERQILSSLDHPHIARLLDGGTTDDGLPYLVMEYVEGEPITRYCDRRGLPVADRLSLFCDVARAVQRAHKRLVVHRDLKPSNILVDREGRVKLLDFGIAKLLSDTPLGDVTRTGLRPLTPAWASPEQVRGEAITTASDVYQLGLLLCVLLAGHPPYEVRALSPARAERAVTEADPTRPSALVSPDTATRRSSSARTLRRRLAGDLDTIVLHALRSEPERRYESAAALVDDVERHLAGQPVAARPDTVGYRAAKFVQRHRVAVAAAAVVVMALGTSAWVAVVQARHATVERDRAQAAAARAETVTAFVTDLIRMADPNAQDASPTAARRLLEVGRARADSQLAGQPQVHADVLASIGEMYQRLGLFDESREALVQAVALRRSGPHDPGDLVEDLDRLASATTQHDLDQAMAVADEAVAVAEDELAPDDVRLATALTTWAEIMGQARPEPSGKRQKLAAADRAVEILRGHGDSIETRLALASALHAAAIGRERTGGEQRLREALALRRSVYGSDHASVAATLHDLALMLETSDPAAADSLLEQAVAIETRIHGPEHAHTLNMLNSVAGRFRDKGEYSRAAPLYREVLRRRREAYPDDSLGHAYPMHGLGWTLAELGEGAEAERILREMMEILRNAGDDLSSLRYQVGRSTLGRALAVQGRYAEAEPLLVESYEWLADAHPDDRRYLPTLRQRVVELYEAWGRPDEAAVYRRQAEASAPDAEQDGG